MTFSNEFTDICKNQFNIDISTISHIQLRLKLEDILDEHAKMIILLIGSKEVEENLLISKELNNQIYFSKKLYNEFMEEFNK